MRGVEFWSPVKAEDCGVGDTDWLRHTHPCTVGRTISQHFGTCTLYIPTDCVCEADPDGQSSARNDFTSLHVGSWFVSRWSTMLHSVSSSPTVPVPAAWPWWLEWTLRILIQTPCIGRPDLAGPGLAQWWYWVPGKVRSSFAFLAVTGLSEETALVSEYISQSRALPSTQTHNDCVCYLV